MTSEDWNLLQERFGKLHYYIARRITGDCSQCDIEDNLQDIYLAADSAVKGFRKKNNTDAPLSEFVDTRLFHAYYKTTIWNKKNAKGLKATRHKDTFVHFPEDYVLD